MATRFWTSDACPLCREGSYALGSELGAAMQLTCHNCGNHRVTREALEVASQDPKVQARVGHEVAKAPDDTLITAKMLEEIGRSDRPLPSPLERIDLLVSLLAKLALGDALPMQSQSQLRARCEQSQAVHWVLSQALSRGFTEQSPSGACLSAKGWEHFDQLVRNGSGSRHAFMAMKFGDAQMNVIYADHMRRAVDKAGFDLRTTAGAHATAGSIDNRMRVEIRTSRFLVCDLTHGNRGAYWEAWAARCSTRAGATCCRATIPTSGRTSTPRTSSSWRGTPPTR
jgi:hypothetical protein